MYTNNYQVRMHNLYNNLNNHKSFTDIEDNLKITILNSRSQRNNLKVKIVTIQGNHSKQPTSTKRQLKKPQSHNLGNHSKDNKLLTSRNHFIVP